MENLTGWDLYFKRVEGRGDIKIPARVTNFNYCSYSEVLGQIQTRNVMFVGDGFGAHARIRIADKEARESLFGIKDAKNVLILTAESVKELLAVKSKSDFSKKLGALVKTEAEKKMIVQLTRAEGDNAEAWKIEAIEKASGYSLRFGDGSGTPPGTRSAAAE